MQRDEVVIRYDSNVNVTTLLGEHSWHQFDKKTAPRDRYSYIFEFNYATKGHPDDRAYLLSAPH